MLDFSWSELALIAVVALVVIGPKDLPRVMRVVGQWVRRARSVAHEFQGSIDQMMREAELDDLKRGFDKATSFDVEHEIRKSIDPGGELQHSLSDPVLANPLAEEVKPAIESEREAEAAPRIEAQPDAKTAAAEAPSQSASPAPDGDPAKRSAPDAEPHAS